MMSASRRFWCGARPTLAVLAAIAAVGCAAAPPKQLLDARASYADAASGPAGELTPAELVDAKASLDEAQRVFERDGVTSLTLDAAYVAQRRSQIANSRGLTAFSEAAQSNANDELTKLRDGHMSATEAALAASQGQVVSTGVALAASQGEVVRTAKELAEEKEKRAESDRRLRAAMDKLVLAASLAVKEEPRGTVIILPGNVLFATGKSELLSGAKGKLDAVALAIKDQPDTTITVEGHTDSQGTPESNIELSKRRAESVRAYLESKGVPKAHLVTAGIGETRPIGENSTIEGRAQNRRVEIIVSPREKR